MTSVSPKKGWEEFRSDWQLSLSCSGRPRGLKARTHLCRGLLNATCQIPLGHLRGPQLKSRLGHVEKQALPYPTYLPCPRAWQESVGLTDSRGQTRVMGRLSTEPRLH